MATNNDNKGDDDDNNNNSTNVNHSFCNANACYSRRTGSHVVVIIKCIPAQLVQFGKSASQYGSSYDSSDVIRM